MCIATLDQFWGGDFFLRINNFLFCKLKHKVLSLYQKLF